MKNLYDIFNDANLDLSEYENKPLDNTEVEQIMKKFSTENKSNKKITKTITKTVIGISAAAACCTCILSTALHNSDRTIDNTSKLINQNLYAADSTEASSQVTENSFYITADAAENEKQSYINLNRNSGEIPYSGRSFSINGNNIDTVKISIDKGSLYKADKSKIVQNIGDKENVETIESCEYIGNEYSEKYNPDRCYGFYFDEKIYEQHETECDGNSKNAWHMCYDDLNDAVLQVTVTYNDKSTESVSYKLISGKLEIDKDTMKPNGNISNGDTPYIYDVLLKNLSK